MRRQSVDDMLSVIRMHAVEGRHACVVLNADGSVDAYGGVEVCDLREEWS